MQQVKLVHLPNKYQVVQIITKLLSVISFIKFRHKFKLEYNSTLSLREMLIYIS